MNGFLDAAGLDEAADVKMEHPQQATVGELQIRRALQGSGADAGASSAVHSRGCSGGSSCVCHQAPRCFARKA